MSSQAGRPWCRGCGPESHGVELLPILGCGVRCPAVSLPPDRVDGLPGFLECFAQQHACRRSTVEPLSPDSPEIV
jgi:hypothetical protein